MRVEFSGPKLNVMEVQLGDNVHRETLSDSASFPSHGLFSAAPQKGDGGFTLLDNRKPGSFLVMAWKEQPINVALPRQAVSVSPESDPINLPFRTAGPEPVRLEWLSATTLRASQKKPAEPGDDKDLVRVIRFDAKSGNWYLIYPLPSGNGVIVQKRVPNS